MIKRGQSGVEYLIIIGFVTLAITSILIAAYFYIGMSRDRIRINQIETLASKIISSAESVYFSGQPSQTTITVYLPSNILSIQFQNTDLIISFSTSSGTMTRAFTSRVPFSPTSSITLGEGSRRLVIKAEADYVDIS